jgi:hypothetical protein
VTDKTHYRKAFDSPYLSSADIVDPIVLTIKEVRLHGDKTKKTGDDFNTCYWVERELRPGEALKPMILNATNSKFLAKLTKSKWIDDWAGAKVTVWVDGHVRFGRETVEGLRLDVAKDDPAPPPELVSSAIEASNQGIAAYTAFWASITKDERKLLQSKHPGLKSAAEAVKVDAA